MFEHKFHYLSSIEVFRDLAEHEIEDMARAATVSTCEAGRIFYKPDQAGEVLFFLKRGRVQLYRLSPEGKKFVVASLGPGAIFGEMSLTGQGMHNTYAEAVEECLLFIMRRADVERLLLQRPQVALRFVESLGRRLNELETRLEDVAFKSISGRLAGLLLRLADEQTGTVVEGYTHQDLAERLGTYRETTTQTLSGFRSRGLIEIGRKRIEILDRKGLEAAAV